MIDRVIIVSKTTAISNLIQINQLAILAQLFREVIIPPTVYFEVMELVRFDISVSEFIDACSSRQIQVTELVDSADEVAELGILLDKGESEAIVLATEINADWLLMDEKLGRRKAEERGLRVIGLLGVLRLAKQERLVTAVKPLLDSLRSKAGFWFSDKLYQEVLQSVDE